MVVNNNTSVKIYRSIIIQIYGNILLTERYRIVECLKDSFLVVLFPKHYPSTGEEIKSVARYLNPEYAYKLSAVTLEDFVDAIIHYLPEYSARDYERIKEMYWDFDILNL